ncbi:MAG: DivIVA domain-containing protein [Chlorobiales bacterium]|nr:DivIVA domain-containing protein [Chlorobiales bacterium]
MKLTPIDIKKQVFKRILRGYDPAEVDAFLETLSKHWEDLLDQNDVLKRRAQELEMEIQKFKQVENMLHQTLAQAQKSSTDVVENAKREAELIRQEAQMKASQLIDEVQSQAMTIKGDIRRLQVQRHDILNELKHLLSSQLDIVNSYEKKDVFYLTSGDQAQWQDANPSFQGKGQPVYSQVKIIEQEVHQALSGHESDTDVYFRPITPPSSGEKASAGTPLVTKETVVQKKTEVDQFSVPDAAVKPVPQAPVQSDEENNAPQTNAPSQTKRIEISIDSYKSTANNNKINIDDILDSLE